MDTTLELRAHVKVTALGDTEKFIESAKHLKALTLQLQQRRNRESRLQASLAQQIQTFTAHCAELAQSHPRLLELWGATQAELALLVSTPPSVEPCSGAGPSGPCLTGARGTKL